MTDEEKRVLIGAIISTLKFHAKDLNKPFSEGETFFCLVFKTDQELLKIAKLARV